jgi:hypothetical protein
VLEYQEGKLVALSDTERPKLERGDIVWFSLRLSFIIGRECWFPEWRLVNLVRVGRIVDTVGSDEKSEVFDLTQHTGDFILPSPIDTGKKL